MEIIKRAITVDQAAIDGVVDEIVFDLLKYVKINTEVSVGNTDAIILNIKDIIANINKEYSNLSCGHNMPMQMDNHYDINDKFAIGIKYINRNLDDSSRNFILFTLILRDSRFTLNGYMHGYAEKIDDDTYTVTFCKGKKSITVSKEEMEKYFLVPSENNVMDLETVIYD